MLLLNSLKSLIAQAEEEQWTEGDLEDALYEILRIDYDDDNQRHQESRQEYDHICVLENIVQPYPYMKDCQPDTTLPALPTEEPGGVLHGVVIVYDEDQDNRVLVAIEKLLMHEAWVRNLWDPDRSIGKESTCEIQRIRDKLSGIVAVAEHEGVIDVYCREPFDFLESISLCDDEWQVRQWLPINGKWVEMDREFKLGCVHEFFRMMSL